MSTRFALVALTLTGCFQRTYWPACEEVDRVDVADDEVTPAGTAAEALALVALEGTFDGTWADGTPATATLSVGRGAGSAQWVETTSVTEVKRSFGFGQAWPAIYVECLATLEIPLVADATSDDGALDVHVDDRLALSDPADGWQDPIEERLHASLSGSFADATLPVFDNDPDDYEQRYSFITLDYLGGGLATAEVGWGGSRETEEYSSAIADRVLTLEGPAYE